MKKVIQKVFFSFYMRFLRCMIFFFASAARAEDSSALKSSQGPLKKPPMTDIHDIKPLVDIGTGIPWTIILIGVLILALLLAAFFYRRYLRKSIEVKDVIAELPPEINAHRALNQIADVKQIDGKTFYFNLSAILRQYLFERFNLNAPEMTTEELLPQIAGLNLDKDLFDGLFRLCQGADPIKFAGVRPQIRQMEMDLTFARKFVDGTTVKVNDSDEIKQH